MVMLPIYDMGDAAGRRGYEDRLRRLRVSSTLEGRWHEVARPIIDAVRNHGDEAVVSEMRRWTDPHFEAGRIRVREAELDAAERSLSPELRGAIERAIGNVRAYQRHLLPRAVEPMEVEGCELGMRWTPVDSAGLLVPGGSAVLFSTLIMLAVPALEAGVKAERLAVVTPGPTLKEGGREGGGGNEPRDVSSVTLAVARLLGVGRVYRIGGPAAVAALAFGTKSVEPVDFVAGPGHPVVQAAKLQLTGVVGTDGFYGASEIVTLADELADPRRVAADLVAQAEHDPGKCFLVGWQRGVVEAVAAEVQRQLPGRARAEAIRHSLTYESCGVLCRDEAEALAVVDAFAAEHVNLAVRDPDAALARLRHGGEYFLGDATPVAAGDYYAGPSHTLPTGTTARFSSGVSVYTFLKRSGVVSYRGGMSAQAVEDIARMAEAEGLDGHAASVRMRRG